ncbi:hypothetical protein E4T56_gene3065 [Termitomyces sp. T112]|nr:hypothetical protein E4T56_gene3065 [Termitomyces sp. T112]
MNGIPLTTSDNMISKELLNTCRTPIKCQECLHRSTGFFIIVMITRNRQQKTYDSPTNRLLVVAVLNFEERILTLTHLRQKHLLAIARPSA